MARPTKYTDQKAQDIATLLKAGATRKAAAESVGITRETFYQWLKNNLTFLTLVQNAEAIAEVDMTLILTSAAQKDWKVALEWLKRRRREDWGDSVKHELPSEVVTLVFPPHFLADGAAGADGKASAKL